MSTPPPPPISTSISNNASQTNISPKQPITLPQVLSIFEKRLIALEKNAVTVSSSLQATPAITNEVDESLRETLEEYESRFEMLAEQINHIKDTLMKLQTFTMDVNKTLLEERVHIMKDQSEVVSFSEAVFSELGSVDITAVETETAEEDDDE